MRPALAGDGFAVYLSDCIEGMARIPDNSMHAVVTDPPYLLGFMGRQWDTKAAHQHLEWHGAWAAQAFRVLRPGGHLLAFGGTRTWHRLAVAIEDAGFEIRDSIAWLYGSGFPKSLDISKAIDKGAGVAREVVGARATAKGNGGNGNDFLAANSRDSVVPITDPATPAAQQWAGWGTALKPAFEPLVVARKPLVGTVAANTLAHGVGGLNIDGCRIETEGDRFGGGANGSSGFVDGYERGSGFVTSTQGRWPANVVLDEHTAEIVDAQSGISKSSGGSGEKSRAAQFANTYGEYSKTTMGANAGGLGDSGGASRFFYQAKAGKSERPKVDGQSHPTIKPLTLMRWLVRLVTPPGGYVLEPFAGSGTTIQAALMEGFKCIAFESEASYIPHIQARLTDAMLLQAPAQEPETETEEVSR